MSDISKFSLREWLVPPVLLPIFFVLLIVVARVLGGGEEVGRRGRRRSGRGRLPGLGCARCPESRERGEDQGGDELNGFGRRLFHAGTQPDSSGVGNAHWQGDP